MLVSIFQKIGTDGVGVFDCAVVSPALPSRPRGFSRKNFQRKRQSLPLPLLKVPSCLTSRYAAVHQTPGTRATRPGNDTLGQQHQPSSISPLSRNFPTSTPHRQLHDLLCPQYLYQALATSIADLKRIGRDQRTSLAPGKLVASATPTPWKPPYMKSDSIPSEDVSEDYNGRTLRRQKQRYRSCQAPQCY